MDVPHVSLRERDPYPFDESNPFLVSIQNKASESIQSPTEQSLRTFFEAAMNQIETWEPAKVADLNTYWTARLLGDVLLQEYARAHMAPQPDLRGKELSRKEDQSIKVLEVLVSFMATSAMAEKRVEIPWLKSNEVARTLTQGILIRLDLSSIPQVIRNENILNKAVYAWVYETELVSYALPYLLTRTEDNGDKSTILSAILAATNGGDYSFIAQVCMAQLRLCAQEKTEITHPNTSFPPVHCVVDLVHFLITQEIELVLMDELVNMNFLEVLLKLLTEFVCPYAVLSLLIYVTIDRTTYTRRVLKSGILDFIGLRFFSKQSIPVHRDEISTTQMFIENLTRNLYNYDVLKSVRCAMRKLKSVKVECVHPDMARHWSDFRKTLAFLRKMQNSFRNSAPGKYSCDNRQVRTLFPRFP